MYKKKIIAATITARRSSSRLRDKVLLPFGNSTVVETVIDRIKHSNLCDFFILATSTDPNDDVFKRIASRGTISLFRGNENDVVSRMVAAVEVEEVRPDIIVRICADNPLLMPSVIDEAIERLIDRNADIITPFEFNTYPFGYSMVVMTRECLERIDREAKEDTYREHVENYCFEHQEKFRILYQKAPELLHFRDLNLTLDYEVDYIRLKRFYELLKNIPYNDQPRELISRIMRCRVGVLLEDEAVLERVVEVLTDKCQSILGLFCYSRKGVKGKKSLTAYNGSACSEVNIFTDDNIARLLDMIKSNEYDLFISSLKIPSGHGIMASQGVVLVDDVEVANKRRYCLRYDNFNDEKLNSLSNEPIFIDFRSNISHETRDDFLLRVLPLTIKQLVAGPVRPAKKQEAFYPPEEKLGIGKRRGFPDSMAVDFPSLVLVEMVEKTRNKDKTKMLCLDGFLQDKLINEIRKYPFVRIRLGVLNDPINHPGFKSFLEDLNARVGKERVLYWPEKEVFKGEACEDLLFQQILLSANGSLRYSLYDNSGETVVGDFYKTSIAEAWQSKKMQYARVDILNAVVPQ